MLHHSGARAVFVEDAEQLAKVRAVEADLPELEFVIVIDPADADGSTISLAALRERGRGRAQAELEERLDSVTPEAGCLLLYTSGTTGPPKACELTHGNYRAITSALETQDLVRQDDCVYLFLPLAHALALIVQFLVLDVGATLAYWEKDPQKIVANLMELKPTFFPSVPRIFEKIHTLATTAGDTRELEQATRVGMAVRQAQHRAEEVPADLQAAFERAEQALYANVRNLLRVGCERSPRRPNPAGGAASRRLSRVSHAHPAPITGARAWLSAATAPGSPQPGCRVARGGGRRSRGRDLSAAGPGARPWGFRQGMGGRPCRRAARAPRTLRRRLWRRPAGGGRPRRAVGGARAPSADRRDRAHAPRPRRRRGDLWHRRATVAASGGRLRPPPDRPRHWIPRLDGAGGGHRARPDRLGGRGAREGRLAIRPRRGATAAAGSPRRGARAR